MTRLTTAQLDRAAGVLLGTAAGDALGAGYEFGPPLSDDIPVLMEGGGGFGWAPGEWTDDTSMALVIAQVAADGFDLRGEEAQDTIALGWAEWATDAKDVGIQTSAVLGAAGRAGVSAASLRAAARDHHRHSGRSGGNGSLMRTAPVAIAYLDDEDGLVEAATTLSALTHFDPEAGEACVLWCLAIRHAVLTGELDVHVGLPRLSEDRAAVWARRIAEAEAEPPSAFDRNGWVVQALQGAWSAISRTPIPVEDPSHRSFRPQHLQLALEAAVRGGYDTDTVAAIAGGLLGGAYGASAVPANWRRIIHGWPGLRAAELTRLATTIASHGRGDRSSQPHITYSGDLSALARHPHDDGVWLGGFGALARLPEGVDAVVSLCQVGTEDVAASRVAPADHVEVRLIDNADPTENVNLGFVLSDAADAVEELRRSGHTVLLHCVQTQSRTPTVAALYGARRAEIPVEQALAEVCAVLPAAHPNPAFLRALRDAQ